MGNKGNLAKQMAKEKAKQAAKKMAKKALKKALLLAAKPLLIAAAVILIASIIVSSILHFLTVFDGTAQDGDWSNVPYASDQYGSNIQIDGAGNITTNMSAKELWDKLIENDSRVNQYLDTPEELKKLLNAELVTDFLDTRPNPNDPIDWDSINNDAESKKIQGIIKLKRAMNDGNTITMVYTDPETFQCNIDKYNDTGSEQDKQVALSYFTLEKGFDSSNFGTGAKITAGTTIMVPGGLGSVHTYMGWQCITAPDSLQYKLRDQAGMNFDEEGFGRINGRYVIACTTTFGAVGDYVDFYQEDGSVIQCIIGDIKNQNDAGCNEWGHLNGTCIIEFVVDKNTWYSAGNGGQASSMHVNPGQGGFHMEWNQNIVKAINGGSYFDNPSFGGDPISGNGSEVGVGSSGQENMRWPTDGTTITSEFGWRSAPTAGASTNHRGVDIGIPTGTNVYAVEAGTVTTAGFNQSAGNWVIIDHGNGYVTKYMHNSALKVTAGEKVEKGQVIALSGSTGISTGPHLHFQIEYNGQPVDPLTFKYENGMGGGAGGIGSNPNGLSTGSKYYAKVATWNEITDTLTSTDPEVEEYNTTRHNMTSTRVNYQDLVSGYTMPFEYLWSFLVVGQEKEFVLELADLVYGSEIEITVHDNLTVNTNVNTDTYTEKTKIKTDVTVGVTYSETVSNSSTNGNSSSGTVSNGNQNNNSSTNTTVTRHATESGNFEKELSADYKTIHTVITKTNTLDVSLTKANVWIVEYTKDYAHQIPNPVNTVTDSPQDDVPYTDTPAKTEASDSEAGLGEAFRQQVQSNYESQYSNVSTRITNISSQYYYSTVNRNININNTMESTKYVASPANIKEKTDPNSTEPNFVTIYMKKEHYKNASNIHSATQWLFEIIEKNKSTSNMVDLTKYLLYKATGEDYGITEFDFSIFDPSNFQSLSDQYGGVSNIGGIPGQVYDFLLSKGVPPVGAAAIMGNIEGESSFNPSAVNSLGCSGLCQWYKGRFDNLKSLASSKGTSWTDVDTQLEHLWHELETSYTSVKDVIMNATEESDMEYATWYFGRYYEVFFTGSSFEGTKHHTQKRYEYAQKWYKQWKTNHTGSSSGSVQAGEAARIQGTEERIAWLYDGNGLPTSKAENDKYLETFPVEYLDRNGNRQTMNITMHRKLKTEVQAIFKEMANAGFKVIGGNISYRAWGSDAGFSGRFPQSAHTYGHAFDVNPTQNYCIYANGNIVGDHYSPGSDPYSVTAPIINIWKQHGFYWGGDWTSLKDYMHFSYFNH